MFRKYVCLIFSVLLLACSVYIYSRLLFETNGCYVNQEPSTWSKLFNWFPARDTTPVYCNIWLWKTHWKTIVNSISQVITVFGYNAKDGYLSIIVGTSVISIVAFVIVIYCCGAKSKHVEHDTNMVCRDQDQMINSPMRKQRRYENSFDYKKFVLSMLLLALVLSVPWEFIRLYQQEVSKRTAIASQGAPEECTKGSTSLIQSVKYFLQWQFSWSSLNQCENYYYVLLVDPLWELTPLMVISSAITRCLLHPMELLFSGFGRSFRAFFVEIPIQWQPVVLVMLYFILLLVILMTCRYKLHIPFLFKIEPKTPIHVQDNHHIQNASYLSLQSYGHAKHNESDLQSKNVNSINKQEIYSANFDENVLPSNKVKNRDIISYYNCSNDQIILKCVPSKTSLKSKTIKQSFAVKSDNLIDESESSKPDKTVKQKITKKKSQTSNSKYWHYEDDPDFIA